DGTWPASSTRVLDGTRLAHDRHLHLARVLHVLLDAVGDVACKQHCGGIVDALWLNDDAQLASSLDGEGTVYAREASCDALETLEALDVALERLAPSTRPRGRNGVCGVDDDGEERLGLIEVMVVRDGVDDFLRFAESPPEVGADLRVRTLDLAVDRLADVVQEASAARHGLVKP